MRIVTSAGPAEIELERSPESRFLLVLTHGSGGGTETADLLAVRDAALASGAVVASVQQPYRVAGRRAPGSAAAQDAAWLEIIAGIRAEAGTAVPLIQGGRSNGARVACRTARAVAARGIIALSFPLHPPGKPEKTRRDELLVADPVDVLVINGGSDPFGIPDAADAAEVRVIPGQPHSFRKGFDVITDTVTAWLQRWVP